MGVKTYELNPISMFNESTVEEAALGRQLNSFFEVVDITRLQRYLRITLLIYLQQNSAGYHLDFAGMMTDLEFLHYLLEDIAAVQAAMPPVP